jgi:hypothetical protein
MFPLVMLGRLMAAPLMKLGAGVAKGGSALAEGAAKLSLKVIHQSILMVPQ